MAVAQVVDARFNPANPEQRVVLWGNGRIDTFNTATITDGPQYFDRVDQPVVVAIWIVNWTTMAGYVLDKQGGFHRINGAPSIGESSSTGIHEVVVGVPYWKTGIYVDWSWDPFHPGRGVVLDGFGTLHAFGGAPMPPRVGHRWPLLVFRKLQMSWAPDMRAYSLDYAGRIHADYSAVPIAPYWYWNGDMAVDFQITNWANGGGYMLDRNGGIWVGGGVQHTYSPSHKLGVDRARILRVLSADDPLRLWELWSFQQEIEWVASTPPTVVAGGYDPLTPASNVTGTSRPMLAWAYTDAQQDSQDEVRVLVFTQAFVNTHTMTDPERWANDAVAAVTVTDPTARGVASPVDLPNGAYRMYVRAKDTAEQWSPWSNRPWTQAVPLPATPTGLTAVADDSSFTVALSVNATTGGVATLVRFECSDDAGASWQPVRGADAVPLAATTTAVDLDPRLGVQRTYRAVADSVDPRAASLPSSPATAKVDRRVYVLTAVSDPALGGEIRAAESDWSRPPGAGVAEGVGTYFPTVVSDGGPKARRGTLRITTQDRAQWVMVKALGESDSVLLLRDPFGEAVYCRLVGDWSQRLIEAAPLLGEETPLRHMHSTELPMAEVAPPHVVA